MTFTYRKKAVFAFALMSAVMGMTATAWACTAQGGFRGSFTLAQSGQTTQTNIGASNTSTALHAFCKGSGTALMTLSKSTSTFTVSGAAVVAPAACPGQLPAGTNYDLKFQNSATLDCLSGTIIGSKVTVASGGYSQVVSTSALTVGSTKQVCISDAAHTYGMQMNVSTVV